MTGGERGRRGVKEAGTEGGRWEWDEGRDEVGERRRARRDRAWLNVAKRRSRTGRARQSEAERGREGPSGGPKGGRIVIAKEGEKN